MKELEFSFESMQDAIEYFSQILPDPETTDKESIVEVFNVTGQQRRFRALKSISDWSIAMVI